ncbi:hypothetical protein BKA65DRAFT_589522 [Rhexocercosporidium sp. MPI-PUGE-AT-0058]|nr:hypothetical protein BKA65DRAFT_589522 [Rhexocercosporidium sp. MPI-PUGE-AT-0058]
MPTLRESDEIPRTADEICRNGLRWRARWLLRKWRPDPNHNHDKTPLRELLLLRVVEKGYVALIQDLLPKRKSIKEDIVHHAILGEAPIPVLGLFLARGWDINSNLEYSSALVRAIRQGDETLFDWLLLHEADPNRQRDYLHAPLVLAACYGHIHMVKSLTKHGANLKDTEALCWVTSSDHETAKPFDDGVSPGFRGGRQPCAESPNPFE